MSSTIDQRVVEMRFDNKQFESGVKESLSTLDRLKEALKFSTSKDSLEGLQKAAKNVDMSSIAQACDTINDRFSALGIIGARVLENLTDKVMSFASNAISGTLGKAFSFVSDSIISGGLKRAQNIENAHFQLQALLKDEGKVQAVMDNAMEAVDGTAYAYDEAAKAASQFAASGVESGEKMLNSLKGITGVAAMTNSDFESISKIFTTVAGNGRLMGDQLLQLSSRGLNAASTIKDYFNSVNEGTAKVTDETAAAIKELSNGLEVSEADIREWVSGGKISFAMFSEAMTDAFGESAKRANETFTGAFSNMKSAFARIGAGFFSPLIEQNGELVQLFNALRVQINNIKGALVFDEATSAISGLNKIVKQSTSDISDFTGMTEESIEHLRQLGETFGYDSKQYLEELKVIGEGDVEQMDRITAALRSDAKTAFDDIKNGKRTIDDFFKDLQKNGKDGYKALTDYVNGVEDGSIRASYAVKSAIQELQNQKLENYINKVADGSTKASAKITDAINQIAVDGKVSMDQVQKLFDSGVLTLEDFGDAVKLTQEDIRKAVEEGKVDFATFQAAMENAFGDQKQKLSKQFTDAVQDAFASITNWVNNLDLTKPMEVFYNNVESIKNLIKGLGSILGPIGRAFLDAFFPAGTMDKMVAFSARVEEITAKMRLSEKGQKNLHDAFKGVFDVVKLVIDIFGKLIGVTIHVGEPAGSLLEVIIGIAGAFGRALTAATEWIRGCEPLRVAFGVVSNAIQTAMHWLANLGTNVKNLATEIWNMEGTQKIVGALSDIFTEIGEVCAPYVDVMVDKLRELKDWLLQFIPTDTETILQNVTEWMGKLADKIGEIDPTIPAQKLSDFIDKIKEFWNSVQSGGSGIAIIDAFVGWIQRLGDNMSQLDFSIGKPIDSIKNFFKAIAESIDFDKAVSAIKDGLGSAFDWLGEKIDSVKDKFGEFKDFWDRKIMPLFDGLSIGGIIGTGLGIGLVKGLIDLAKGLKSIGGSVADTLGKLPSVLDGVSGALEAYQKDLNANALLKTAAAIAVLALALAALTFVDSGKLMASAIALSLVAGVFLIGFAKLQEAINAGKKVKDQWSVLQKGLSSMFKDIGKSFKIKALGSTVKNFALSIAIVAASIIALGVMYSKDEANMNKAIDLIKQIGIVMLAVMGLGTLIGSIPFLSKGAEVFKKAGTGMIAIALSIGIIIGALNKLFKMDFPSDWRMKLNTLEELLVMTGVLAVVLGVANRIAGGQKFGNTGVLAFAAALYLTVSALGKLFKMDIPSDYKQKLKILEGLFAGLLLVIIAFGVAGKLAGGGMKGSAAAILAMCAFIVVAVGSIMVLSIFPAEALKKGATALGVILMTLAVAMWGAGKVTSEAAGKALIAMAIDIGVIVAALAILSMFPAEALKKACIALGSMLLVLAVDLVAAGKIANGNSYKPILAMMGSVIVLAAGLAVLAHQPWEGMLAGAAALSAVLLVYAKCLKTISSLQSKPENFMKKMQIWLLGIVGIAAIGIVLGAMAYLCPWDSLLASGAAVSAVLFVYSKVFESINKSKDVDKSKIQMFLLGTIGVAIIGVVLGIMANLCPWDSLLAAAGAVSAVLLAYAATFAIIGRTEMDWSTMLQFLAGCAGVVAIGLVLGEAAKQDWQSLLAAGVSISIVLLAMALAMGICALVGDMAVGALLGIGLLDLFIADLLGVLYVIGNLSKGTGDTILAGCDMLIQIAGKLGQAIGEFIGEIFETAASKLPQIGTYLSQFYENASGFFNGVSSIDEGAMNGVKMLAEAILILTAADILDGLTSWFTGGSSLSSFGEELAQFGPKIAEFADSVSGIDGAAIESAANACKIMAEAASQLPNNGGLAGKIFGENPLSEFGEELESFGPHIAEFAETVKDVKPEAVKGAAEAASIMSEMASKLPNSGGLSAKIFGDNTLAEFGKELKSFGPHIKKFAEDVKDVKPEAVQGAASAAQMMADLANTLPNSGGLAAKILGDNTLSAFGEELEKFGPHIKKYAEDVKDVKAEVVTGSANAAKSIAELANNLPNSGGLVSLFTGDNDLASFGEQMAKFGAKFKEYYNSIAGIDTAKMSSVITEVNKLIEIAKGTASIDTSGMTRFAQDLTTMGNNGVDGFITAFTNANSEVQTAVSTMIGYAVSGLQSGDTQIAAQALTIGNNMCTQLSTGITSKQSLVTTAAANLCTALINQMKTSLPQTNFTAQGQNIVTWFINGINAKKSLLLTTMKNLMTALIQQMKTSLPQATFRNMGMQIIQWFIDGMNAKKALLLTTMKNLCVALIQQMKTSLPQSTFKSMGEQIIQWLIDGMNSKKSLLLTTMKNLCEALIAEMKKDLPKSTFYDMGAQIVTWIADGIKDNTSKVTNAMKAVAEAIKNAINVSDTNSDMYKSMWNIGKYICEAIAKGIEDNKSKITDAAKSAAKAAYDAAAAELDINSPSRVMYELAKFIPLGMAKGILDYISVVEKAATQMADGAIDPIDGAVNDISSVFEDGLSDLTIRPVLDLSLVEQGAQKAGELFSGINLSGTYSRALSASGSFAGNLAASNDDINTGTNSQSGGVNMTFNQYNNSPKSLSRSEIYRQTNNQFAAAVRKVEAIAQA